MGNISRRNEMPLIRAIVEWIRNQQNLYLIPPTSVAWLLQYSGSRVEHRDGFSSRKMTYNEVQNGEFVLDFKV